jgi:hypothetical protein
MAFTCHAEYGVVLRYLSAELYWLNNEKKGPFYPVHGLHGHYRIQEKKIEIFQHPASIPSASLITCIIAHELGHHIDMTKLSNNDRSIYCSALSLRDEIQVAPRNIYPELRAVIYNGEDRAWSNAFEVLNRLGYKEWAFFMAVRDYCLGSYKDAYHIR